MSALEVMMFPVLCSQLVSSLSSCSFRSNIYGTVSVRQKTLKVCLFESFLTEI